MKTVAWEDFEPICLELIDEVEATRESIMIMRDGKGVLMLQPVEPDGGREISSK